MKSSLFFKLIKKIQCNPNLELRNMEKHTMLKYFSQNLKQTECTMLAVKFFYYQSKEAVHSMALSVSIFITSFFVILEYCAAQNTPFSFYPCSIVFLLSIDNCTGNVRLHFGVKEGTNLVQIKKFTIKIKVGKGSLKLSNLFNGDKVLGKTHLWVNKILMILIDFIVSYFFFLNFRRCCKCGDQSKFRCDK